MHKLKLKLKDLQILQCLLKLVFSQVKRQAKNQSLHLKHLKSLQRQLHLNQFKVPKSQSIQFLLTNKTLNKSLSQQKFLNKQSQLLKILPRKNLKRSKKTLSQRWINLRDKHKSQTQNLNRQRNPQSQSLRQNSLKVSLSRNQVNSKLKCH